MNLTADQKRICEQVLNVFETGTPLGKYGAISIYADGPGGIKQITYGRSQTTEYGNLKELLNMYCKNPNAKWGSEIQSYVEKVGKDTKKSLLVEDENFKNLLKEAGKKDPIMVETQDEFFDKRYFQKALNWANLNGFKLPLSVLVIYDSFIHSGGILDFLRKPFKEVPPAKGGDEKAWIKAYVKSRHNWLASKEGILKRTVYRVACFEREMDRENWDLSIRPINANGVMVN